jgi:hypothetical protein
MAASGIRTKSVTTSVHRVGKIFQNLAAIWIGSPENVVYGNSAVLSHFAGVNHRRVPGRLQHGWPAHARDGLYYKNDFLFTYVWRASTERAANQRGWSNFRAIGAPWLYLLKILEADGWDISTRNPDDNQGNVLWVYGRHSLEVSHGANSRLIHFLKEANSNSSGRDICLLYFEDFDSLSTRDFSTFPNLEIVTLGQRSSSFVSDSHLVRLFHLLRECREIRIDHPSTLVLYALTLDVRVNWIRNSSWEEALNVAQELELGELVDLMNSLPSAANHFKSFAFNHLGAESLKNRDELKEILGWGSRFQEFSRGTFSPLLTLVCFPVKVLQNLRKLD